MRILKVYDGDYPWDVRVEKVTETLCTAGHSVRLLCRNRRKRPSYERLADKFDVYRLPGLPDGLTFPFPLNPVWVVNLIYHVLQFRPKRLLVRDLPLAPLVVTVGRLMGIPVIADLAEPYPASLRSLWQFHQMSFVDRIVRNPWFAEQAEQFVVRAVDHVLVVCPEAGRRLEGQGLSSNAWTEVGNTVALDRFLPQGSSVPELNGAEARCRLLFSGLLAGDRGIDVALKALALLSARQPQRFALVIVGEEGPKLAHRSGSVRALLEAQVLNLGLENDVHFTGWIDHDRLPDLITRVHIGLLPFRACEHINCTLANKLFEYMALGLPVIAADVPPMKRVLEATKVGVTFRAGDAEDLAHKVELIADDPRARAQYAEAGRRASKEVFNWYNDGARLLRAVERPDRNEFNGG